jgi:DNA-binding transcriptional regulator YiaG
VVTLLQLFVKYNKLIKTHESAVKFFEENPDKVDTKIDKYRALVSDMTATIKEIRKSYNMSNDEIAEGFRQVEYLIREGAIKC